MSRYAHASLEKKRPETTASAHDIAAAETLPMRQAPAFSVSAGAAPVQGKLQRKPKKTPEELKKEAEEKEAARAKAKQDNDDYIRAQLPTGVNVSIALRPNTSEIESNAQAAVDKGLTLQQLYDKNKKRWGDKKNVQALAAELPTRGAQAATLADAKVFSTLEYKNDEEFERQAEPHAKSQKSIGLDNGALTVGKHLPFERTDHPISMIQDLSRKLQSQFSVSAQTPEQEPAELETKTPAAAGKTPGQVVKPAETPKDSSKKPTSNIHTIAVFTHGWPSGMQLGKDKVSGASFAQKLSDYVTQNVNVILYACSAAKGEGSFAETMAKEFGTLGHESRVFGHTSAAHTTHNYQGREFRSDSQGNVTGRYNIEMVMAGLWNADIQGILDDLDDKQPEKRAADESCTDHRVTPAMLAKAAENRERRQKVTDVIIEMASNAGKSGAIDSIFADASKIKGSNGHNAAYEIGYDPEGTVKALKDRAIEKWAVWFKKNRADILKASRKKIK